MKIKDLTVNDPSIIVHKNIPTIPFNMCVYGKSGTGKTNIILNLFTFYKKIFNHRLIIFTKSRNGSLYSLENSMDAKIFNSLNNENGCVITQLLHFQKSRKENNMKLKNICILFDDFITDDSFN